MTYPHDGCYMPCHFARERSETSYRSNCSQNTPAASRRPTASRLVFRIVTTYPDPPPQFPAYIRISCLPTIRQNGKYHVVIDPGGGGVRVRERDSFCTHTPKEQHHGYMREGRSAVWISNQRRRARKWPSPHSSTTSSRREWRHCVHVEDHVFVPAALKHHPLYSSVLPASIPLFCLAPLAGASR